MFPADSLREMVISWYGSDSTIVERQSARYTRLQDTHRKLFGTVPRLFISVPGRVELGGNHTDHQGGRVLAAAVTLDLAAVAAPATEPRLTLYSGNRPQPIVADLENLQPRPEESGTTKALLRGVAAGLDEAGYALGGATLVLEATLPAGAGLGSSAALELLVGETLNRFYNDGAVPPLELARTGWLAENRFYGNPSGLLDQTVCARGGIMALDFRRPESPQQEQLPLTSIPGDYQALVVLADGGHARLTSHYAAIPEEMQGVARKLGGKRLAEIPPRQLQEQLSRLRRELGDRALLRARHFFAENRRVGLQVDALRRGDWERFLQLVRESGDSSHKWLQNIHPARSIRRQGLALALSLVEEYLAATGKGACRVHGGGFAGGILVFLPRGDLPGLRKILQPVFGPHCLLELEFREKGMVSRLIRE